MRSSNLNYHLQSTRRLGGTCRSFYISWRQSIGRDYIYSSRRTNWKYYSVKRIFCPFHISGFERRTTSTSEDSILVVLGIDFMFLSIGFMLPVSGYTHLLWFCPVTHLSKSQRHWRERTRFGGRRQEGRISRRSLLDSEEVPKNSEGTRETSKYGCIRSARRSGLPFSF